MNPLTLGIDVGTTTTKAVLADVEGKLFADAAKSYTYSKPCPDWVEQNPEDWWDAVCHTIRELLRQHPDARQRIAAIGVSGQGVASVLIDAQGRPLRPAILWLDSRSAPQSDELNRRCGERIAALSGKSPAPYNVEPKLLWVRQNEPEIWRRTSKNLTTTGYVTFRLTGRAVMNHSDAGICLAYDLARLAWSEELAELIGITTSIYCELAACHQVIGSVTPEAAEASGLPAGTPVIAGGEDTSSAGLAMGVTSPDTAQLSMGSASTVYVPLSRAVTDPRLLAFPHVVQGLTLVGGSMVGGGTAMDWTAAVLGGEDGRASKEQLQSLTQGAAEVHPGSDGLIFLPYLAGELQPINDGFARGVFFGLDLSKTRGHMVRAVLEGTAFAIRQNLEITRDLGANTQKLVAVGGPTRNKLWCQIIADVTGLPVEVMHERGGAALGDAILAALGVGLITSARSMQQAHAQVIDGFTPDSRYAARYAELFAIYQELYPRLKDLFPRLAACSR
ncbi:MAG TPA: xylulokinase [Terriglobia bacterium]|nr:xylulokinase [Terriglobia bacterium]